MMRTVTKLGIFMIAALRLCAPAAAADRLTLTSSNPTALEMDQMVARDRGFFARENIDLDVTYMTPDLVIKALLAGTVDHNPLIRSWTCTPTAGAEHDQRA